MRGHIALGGMLHNMVRVVRDEMLFAVLWLACATVVLSIMVARLAKENDQLTLDLFLSELENDALYRKEFENGDAG